MMAGENVFGPQPFGRGVEENLLQRAAMDRKLRPFVTGLDAAGLAPDRLAVLGKIREFPGARAGRIERVEQADFDQLTHGMRQQVDADAERLQFRDALEHFGGNADLVQAERQRQSADAAARDKNGHDKASHERASSHGRAAGGNCEGRSGRGATAAGWDRRRIAAPLTSGFSHEDDMFKLYYSPGSCAL